MFLSFCDTLTFQKEYPNFCGENYSPSIKKAIANDAMTWLNSLPMVEYAHVLVFCCTNHLGGNPWLYTDVLYNMLLQPILDRYYRDLEKYRLRRYLVMTHIWDYAKYTPKATPAQLREKLTYCTCRTKRALRAICEQFRYLKDLELTDPKMQFYVAGVKQIAAKLDTVKWSAALDRLAVAIADGYIVADIVELDTSTADKQQIKDKLNEISRIYGIGEMIDENPNFDAFKNYIATIINELNINHYSGLSSYRALAGKVNEIVAFVNNLKIRTPPIE